MQHGLGVAAGPGDAAAARALEHAAQAGEFTAHLVQFQARGQQFRAVARIPRVCDGRVVGRQRVRQHPHAHPPGPRRGKRLLHVRAGHEVGRDDEQILLGLAHQLQQAVHHRVLLRVCGAQFWCVLGGWQRCAWCGRGLLATFGGNFRGVVHQHGGRGPGPRRSLQVHGLLVPDAGLLLGCRFSLGFCGGCRCGALGRCVAAVPIPLGGLAHAGLHLQQLMA